jgi:hypothetical protein
MLCLFSSRILEGLWTTVGSLSGSPALGSGFSGLKPPRPAFFFLSNASFSKSTYSEIEKLEFNITKFEFKKFEFEKFELRKFELDKKFDFPVNDQCEFKK